MKAKMAELEGQMLDIGRRPLDAIDRVSQPLFDSLKSQVENVKQPQLEMNMMQKSKNNNQIANLNQSIFESRLE